MAKYKATQEVKITLEEKDKPAVMEYLTSNITEFDWNDEWDDEISGSGCVTVYYERTVYYTNNGDGYPGGTFIEDGIDDMWLEEEILDRLGIEVKVNSELRE